MKRNPNIAVITIGYHSYAFEDASQALELMAIMSKAVHVEVETWSLREFTPHTHFLAGDQTLPKLEFVGGEKFNPHETVQEVKNRAEREKKDREDLEQEMKEKTPASYLPAPEVIDEAPEEFL